MSAGFVVSSVIRLGCPAWCHAKDKRVKEKETVDSYFVIRLLSTGPGLARLAG